MKHIATPCGSVPLSEVYTDKETDTQIKKQTDGQTDRQTDGQKDRQTE